MGFDEAGEETNAGQKLQIPLTIEGASLNLGRHLNTSCIKVNYVDRGFNNLVHIVKSGNDKSYVIRLIGPRPRFLKKLKTEAEVAGIHYLTQRFPDLPVPKVLGFCSSKELSGINAEYILMEKLPGRSLDVVWDSMDTKGKCKIATQCGNVLVSMMSPRFDKLGSFALSPKHSASQGLGLDTSTVKAEDITIGRFTELNVGPFPNFLSFFREVCKKKVANLQSSAFMKPQLANLARIEKFIQVMTDVNTTLLLPEVYTNVPMTFCHGDFHPWNMLVDDHGNLSGLLDFEFSASMPIDYNWFHGMEFLGANTSARQVFNEQPNSDFKETFNLAVIAQIRDTFMKEIRKFNPRILPEGIPGHTERALLHYFADKICPWHLADIKTEEASCKNLVKRDRAIKIVSFVLEKYGF